MKLLWTVVAAALLASSAAAGARPGNYCDPITGESFKLDLEQSSQGGTWARYGDSGGTGLWNEATMQPGGNYGAIQTAAAGTTRGGATHMRVKDGKFQRRMNPGQNPPDHRNMSYKKPECGGAQPPEDPDPPADDPLVPGGEMGSLPGLHRKP